MVELRYGTDGYNFKTVETNDYDQALRMYEKVKRFAENHKTTMIIALWLNGWLVQTETVNPTAII